MGGKVGQIFPSRCGQGRDATEDAEGTAPRKFPGNRLSLQEWPSQAAKAPQFRHFHAFCLASAWCRSRTQNPHNGTRPVPTGPQNI